ncbi:MAG TPA: ribulose-phosphate 3-epimerase [Acidimicrobiia bacterium]|nr:ribulose-phosphate 3-epimerase [Acidimicrobiia bacterium]
MAPFRIAPSLLAADFSRLGEQVAEVEKETDLLHLDVMDGHFVPNLSFGIPVIASLRPLSAMKFDCHLMTTNPDAYLTELARAGVDLVTMHIEAIPDPTQAAARAQEAGLEFGLVLSPPTPIGAVLPFLELVSMVLIMSVNPGFGGQSFLTDVLDKVEEARNWIESHGLSADIEIDGGITASTIASARDAGANIFVAGTAVFGDPDPAAAIRNLRATLEARE